MAILWQRQCRQKYKEKKKEKYFKKTYERTYRETTELPVSVGGLWLILAEKYIQTSSKTIPLSLTQLSCSSTQYNFVSPFNSCMSVTLSYVTLRFV